MTIVSSGTISINSLVGEYGGSAPHAMNEYYKGGSYVSNHSGNANVPTSGTIDLADFYGQSNTSPIDINTAGTCGQHLVPGSKYGETYTGINSTTDMSGATVGSWSDNTFTNSSGTSFTITMALSYTSTLTSSSYIGISGNHGGGSLQSVIGYSYFRIGSTTYHTDTGNAGAYISASGHTRYSGTRTTVLPSSGSQTFNWN